MDFNSDIVYCSDSVEPIHLERHRYIQCDEMTYSLTDKV
jgi:hypothetical protein